MVDLDAISNAANGIQDTMDQMATQRVSNLTLSGDDLGGQDLAAVYAEFIERWDLGVVNLEKDGDSIIFRLQACAAAYRSTSEAAAADFQGVISRMSGTDPGMG